MEILGQPAAMLTGATLVGTGSAMAATPKYRIPMALIGAGIGATAGAIWNGGGNTDGGIASNANRLDDPKAYIPLFVGATGGAGAAAAFGVEANLSRVRTTGAALAVGAGAAMVIAGATSGIFSFPSE